MKCLAIKIFESIYPSSNSMRQVENAEMNLPQYHFLNCHVTTGSKCHVTFWVSTLPSFEGYGPYECEDITFLVCHVTTWLMCHVTLWVGSSWPKSTPCYV